MKNNTLLGIIIGAVLLMSFTTVTSNLTKRSSHQVIITSSNASYIEKKVNMKYKEGYRVTNITAQPISTTNYRTNYKGTIIVIMEK